MSISKNIKEEKIMKNVLYIIFLSVILLMFGCNASNEKNENDSENELYELKSIIIEKETEIDELNKTIASMKEEIETLRTLRSQIISVLTENGDNNSTAEEP